MGLSREVEEAYESVVGIEIYSVFLNEGDCEHRGGVADTGIYGSRDGRAGSAGIYGRGPGGDEGMESREGEGRVPSS